LAQKDAGKLSHYTHSLDHPRSLYPFSRLYQAAINRTAGATGNHHHGRGIEAAGVVGRAISAEDYFAGSKNRDLPRQRLIARAKPNNKLLSPGSRRGAKDAEQVTTPSPEGDGFSSNA
jgi:hypothetical protein